MLRMRYCVHGVEQSWSSAGWDGVPWYQPSGTPWESVTPPQASQEPVQDGLQCGVEGRLGPADVTDPFV